MTGGTKGGAQRASSLKPRCIGEVDPETVIHIYLVAVVVVVGVVVVVIMMMIIVMWCDKLSGVEQLQWHG
jgi:hypothetical protein